MVNSMGFRSEKHLFDTAVESDPLQHLANLYPNTTSLVEPRGLFGIPDLVIASLGPSVEDSSGVKAFAFEMKLANWKRALVQAFRYRAFAEMSFVLLDHKHIRPALAGLAKFQRANIGLLSVDTMGGVFVHHQPVEQKPYCAKIRGDFERLLKSEVARRTTETAPDSSVPSLGAPAHFFSASTTLDLQPTARSAAHICTVLPLRDHSLEFTEFELSKEFQTISNDVVGITNPAPVDAGQRPFQYDFSFDELTVGEIFAV
jgi:hypothetical protein